MALTKPHHFVSGTDALAGEVNDNFDSVFTAIGTQEFTENNYVTNDESVTESIDKLDQNLKDVANSLSTGATPYELFSQQVAAPVTIADQVAIFALQGVSSLEAQPFFREESSGDVLRMLTGNATFKTWVYSNVAVPGWRIDATVIDRVLSLKGGTGDYNVNGGLEAGSWTHAHTVGSHTHTFTGTSSGTGTAADESSHTHASPAGAGAAGSGFQDSGNVNPTTAGSAHGHSVSVSGSSAGTTDGGSGNTGANTAFRPYAAVGTLQYPDMDA